MSIQASICVLFLLAVLHAGASACTASTGTTVEGLLMAQVNEGATAATYPTVPSEVPRILVDDLKSRLNDPSLVLIDVRSDGDWDDSRAKIKGAVRERPETVSDWASTYSKDKTIVLYCA